MKFADANLFLRFLAEPKTEADYERAIACKALFERVARGEEILTTSEAVFAEVLFVLVSPRQYGLRPAEASARVRPLVELHGLRLPARRLYLRALDVFATHPHLGFEDALTVAMIDEQGIELLSYDTDFDRIPGIQRQEPTPVDSG